jgi:hypothetical protein
MTHISVNVFSHPIRCHFPLAGTCLILATGATSARTLAGATSTGLVFGATFSAGTLAEIQERTKFRTKRPANSLYNFLFRNLGPHSK